MKNFLEEDLYVEKIFVGALILVEEEDHLNVLKIGQKEKGHGN